MIHEHTRPLKPTELTLNDVRSRLSGLHFAKEVLTKEEREILLLAESLLTLIDNPPVEFTVVHGRRYPITALQTDCLAETLDEIAEIVGFKPDHDKSFAGDSLVQAVINKVKEPADAKEYRAKQQR